MHGAYGDRRMPTNLADALVRVEAFEQLGQSLLGLAKALDRGGVAADQVDQCLEFFLLRDEALVSLREFLFALAGINTFPDPERAHESGHAELCEFMK